MRPALLVLLLLSLLAACNGPPAPQDDGVCWLAGADASGPARFKPVARGVSSLESCAVLLEAMRLQGRAEVDGAFQGYFIFADSRQISSAVHAGGIRYPIFQPPQRASVDRDLTRLMKQQGGALPDAGALSLERQ
jgi:hypothetical protein